MYPRNSLTHTTLETPSPHINTPPQVFCRLLAESPVLTASESSADNKLEVGTADPTRHALSQKCRGVEGPGMGGLGYVRPGMLALAVRACRRRLLEMSGWQEDHTGHKQGRVRHISHVLKCTGLVPDKLLRVQHLAFGRANIENVLRAIEESCEAWCTASYVQSQASSLDCWTRSKGCNKFIHGTAGKGTRLTLVVALGRAAMCYLLLPHSTKVPRYTT